MRASTLISTLFLAVLTAAGPLPAQFSIEQYPDIWNKPEPEEEVEEDQGPPPPPTFSGNPIALPPACSSLRDGLCSPQSPCDFSLELLGVDALGDRVIVYGDQFTDSQTAASVVLATDDGGGTWTEVAAPIPGAVLDRAAFPDPRTAILAGFADQGEGLPRAFLLVTDDGGQRWQRRDIDPGEDDRYGTIVDMRFDSPSHGHVIVERSAGAADPFELYETFNAGRSWSIRHLSSERPRMPGGLRRLAQPDWRIADTETGYQVEKREGAQWASIAAFSEALAQCPTP